ncbi:MAG: ribosome maturation factor RimM [Defluviitaleaceae bacterium]|nr:ribosome maturation factor RimM [Defluviitaleaceae bacterium]
MNKNDFEIGIITKAQGIKGEVRILPTTDDPSRFSLLIGSHVSVDGVEYQLANARQQKNIVIIKFAEVSDRNTAETLIGKKMRIPVEKALPLEENEYYVRDLAGLRVETENGEALGTLTKVIETNANDVYVVEPTDGADPFMIPAIKDVVLKVSVNEGKIIVRLMDGLRELKA